MVATAQPTMRVECAWCDRRLYDTACIPEMVGKVSHGICDHCAECMLRDITSDSFTPPQGMRFSCAVSSATPRRDAA